ncbi:MAG TPA: PKD domain-containing protein, partial [Candidatus Acetothermia bacterium]|nr:PKD domain-containing protein [Candidatus Acetothermia bacterium]
MRMNRRRALVGILLVGAIALLGGCLTQNVAPTASFTATPTSGQAPLAVSFDASASSDPDGTIASYTWNFGDGQNGSGMSGSHIYANEGTFTAILTAIDDGGLMSTASETITVSAPANVSPTAAFTATPDTGVPPLTVIFNAATSQDPDGTIATYDWDFGDGSAHQQGVAMT